MFDNDAAGVNAISKYKQMFDIKGCRLTLSKDISDAVSNYGFDKVHHELKQLLIETLRS